MILIIVTYKIVEMKIKQSTICLLKLPRDIFVFALIEVFMVAFGVAIAVFLL